MNRGKPKYIVIQKQTDQADPLAGAPVTLVFDTLDGLQRGLLEVTNLDNLEIGEFFPIQARVEKKIVLGGPAPSANNG